MKNNCNHCTALKQLAEANVILEIRHKKATDYIKEKELQECDYIVKIKELEAENEHLKIMNDGLNFQKSELIEKFKDLLDDSKYLYQYDPNNFRKTEDEYFKSEIEFLQKYEVKECGTK